MMQVLQEFKEYACYVSTNYIIVLTFGVARGGEIKEVCIYLTYEEEISDVPSTFCRFGFHSFRAIKWLLRKKKSTIIPTISFRTSVRNRTPPVHAIHPPTLVSFSSHPCPCRTQF